MLTRVTKVDQYLAVEANLVYVTTSAAEVCNQLGFYARLMVNMAISWPKQCARN